MSPFSWETIRGMVYMVFLVRSMLGRNIWFQLVTKVNIACVAIAGFMMGRPILLKVANSLEPSIRAESRISIGKEASMNCLMKNTQLGEAIEGRMSARKLFVIPILYMN